MAWDTDICGGEAIYMPETGCDDCADFINRLNLVREQIEQLEELIRQKADKYNAGTNIQINDQNVISATDTTYSEGTGITISGANNQISATMNPSNTYNKTEVNQLLSDLEHIRMTEVSALPASGETNVIYLVPDGEGHDMYIWDVDNSRWVPIGRDVVDLTNYVQCTDLNTVSKDGLVLKSSGQAYKHWRTDASGNPAWGDVVIPVNPSTEPTEQGAIWITT